jgi:capsid protein
MVRSLLRRWLGRGDNSSELAAYRRQVDWLQSYNRRIKARYDAAGTNPELERYWSQADNRSPRAANDVSIRRRLRSRSRYECQESNSFARGMLLTKQNDVIGVGPMLQVNTEDAELNKAIESRWAAWERAVCLPPKIRTLHGAKIGDGEGFAQRTFNAKLRDGVKLDLLLTEADLWTDPVQAAIPNEVDGIRFDEQGNPVSYRRLRQHPGDDIQYSDAWETDEIDADDVIHWFRADRPDQKRGIPEFTAALPLFAELRRYRLAVIAAAETAADFTAVMYSDAPAFGEDPDTSGEPFSPIDLERRAMLTLPAGWKMAQLKAEQPTTEFTAFSEAILCEIGRTAQMPLNLVSGTSREYNFASGRLDYLLYWSHCDVERYDFSLAVMDRIFQWWLDEALLEPGYLPKFGGIRDVPHEWIWPPRRPVDEVKAAQADQIMWQMGYLTDEAWAKREQVDLTRHYEELGRSIERRTAIDAPLPQASLQRQQQEISRQQSGDSDGEE